MKAVFNEYLINNANGHLRVFFLL